MYVNIGAAIAFTFEKALRAGETCPGEAFDPKDHLSRQTIGAVLQPAVSQGARLLGHNIIVVPNLR